MVMVARAGMLGLSAMLGLSPILVWAAACSDGETAGEDPAGTTSVPTTTEVSAQATPSTGTLRLGGADYELTVNCYTSATGVRAVGIGTSPESGDRVEIYVQTDPDAPYLGITLADGTPVDPALDETLDFHLQDDIIRASAIRLARDLNLETGQGEPMGFGDVEIRCSSYEEAPDPNR